MFKSLTLSIVFYLAFLFSSELHAQIISSQSSSKFFVLKGNTLFAGDSLQISTGQKLVIGKGTSENGWYQFIGFKSFFSAPIWINRNLETQNNYDYQANPQIRINDKVRDYLTPGDTLMVTKIRREKDRRTGDYYTVFLTNSEFPGVNFRSNIAAAIQTKELIILSNQNDNGGHHSL